MTKTKMIEINSNQPEQNPEPKKKMAVGVKVLIAVVLVVAVGVGVYFGAQGGLFQGRLFKMKSVKTVELVKVPETIVLKPSVEELLVPEQVELSPKPIIDVPVVIEAKPIEAVQLDVPIVTPAEIVFAYLDRVDPNFPSIYGNVDVDEEQVVLIFRLENLGTQPAYLQGFNVVSSFNTSGAFEGNCHFLASIGGTLVKFNYDSNGNFVNWTDFGADVMTLAGNPDGCFEYSEIFDSSALLIPGNSEVVFGVIKNTLSYLWTAESFAGGWYTGTENCSTIDAEAKLGTYTVVNENGVLLNMGVAADSVTPGMMIFK